MAINRRLLFWLIKAYIKRWRKLFVIYFFIGLVVFFVGRLLVVTFASKIPLIQKQTIGIVGAYTLDNLPPFLLTHVSHGLTRLDKNGIPQPDLAASWKVQDNGKTYIFVLRANLYFSDGSTFTSQDVNYSFSDVSIQKPNALTIIYHLKDTYSPFLVTVSRPIFKDNFSGINGDYKVKEVKLNGNFVETLTLASEKNPYAINVYSFYPTQEALRLAFVLGDISQAVGLTDLAFKNTTFTKFPNATITQDINYTQLVTLFYNTTDKDLSNKKLREALSYALPNSYAEGKRAFSSILPTSYAYAGDETRLQDYEHAKLLFDSAGVNNPTFTIATLPKYESIAKEIAASWKPLGIQTKIVTVTNIPPDFQIFLGSFNLPKDPDQYSLWHSGQDNNITKLDDKRIDLLLENGRKTLDEAARIKIYSDFQKYLSDGQPASFLFYPYSYTVVRK